MTESILLTIKKMLGIAEEYHAFDLDITININSVFLTLWQLGVGPDQPFQITGETETWGDFADTNEVPGIQTYVYLKVRLLFDPPTNSFLVDNIQKQIAELEFRLNIQVDTKYPEKEGADDAPEEGGDEPVNPSDVEMVEMPPEKVRVIYETATPDNNAVEIVSQRSVMATRQSTSANSVKAAIARIRSKSK